MATILCGIHIKFLVVASGHFLEIYRIFGYILTLSSLHIML